MHSLYIPLAQRIMHRISNPEIEGSSPSWDILFRSSNGQGSGSLNCIYRSDSCTEHQLCWQSGIASVSKTEVSLIGREGSIPAHSVLLLFKCCHIKQDKLRTLKASVLCSDFDQYMLLKKKMDLLLKTLKNEFHGNVILSSTKKFI